MFKPSYYKQYFISIKHQLEFYYNRLISPFFFIMLGIHVGKKIRFNYFVVPEIILNVIKLRDFRLQINDS